MLFCDILALEYLLCIRSGVYVGCKSSFMEKFCFMGLSHVFESCMMWMSCPKLHVYK